MMSDYERKIRTLQTEAMKLRKRHPEQADELIVMGLGEILPAASAEAKGLLQELKDIRRDLEASGAGEGAAAGQDAIARFTKANDAFQLVKSRFDLSLRLLEREEHARVAMEEGETARPLEGDES